MKGLAAILATTAVMAGALWGAWRLHEAEEVAPLPPAPPPPPAPAPAPEAPARTPQEELLARFDEEQAAALDRLLAALPKDPPLPRLLARLEAQERRERFLQGLLPEAEWQARLELLGPDPFRQLGVEPQPLEAAPSDRAEALAAHWRTALAPALDEAALRGRAAATVWSMDRVKESSPPDDPRGLERRLLGVLVEAEAALAPGKGSPAPLRFRSPGQPPAAPVSSPSP